MSELREAIEIGISQSEKRHEKRTKDIAINLFDKYYLLIDLCNQLVGVLNKKDFKYALFFPNTIQMVAVVTDDLQDFEIRTPLSSNIEDNFHELSNIYEKNTSIESDILSLHFQYKNIKNDNIGKLIRSIIIDFMEINTEENFIIVKRFQLPQYKLSSEDSLLSTFQGYLFLIPKNKTTNLPVISKKLEEQFVSYIKNLESLSIEDRYAFISKTLKDVRSKQYKDTILGVYNREKLNVDIENYIQKVNEGHGDFSLISVHVDDIEKIRKDLGAVVANKVLIDVTKGLEEMTLNKGGIYRYGENEIAILLYRYSSNEAYGLAEQIRENIEKLKVPCLLQNKYSTNITASCIIVTYPEMANNFEDLIKKNDVIIAEVIKNGKNSTRLLNRKEIHASSVKPTTPP